MALWTSDRDVSMLGPAEPRAWTWLCAVLATALAGVFLATAIAFQVPAHDGVDQNGYLAGGRILAERGTAGLSTVDPATGVPNPYAFVGRMWIGADLGTDHERYFPKYPPGLPGAVALAWWIGGPTHGPTLAYLVNPLCMALGVLGTFVAVRLVAGSTLGLLAAAALCASPTIVLLSTNPNSHAGALGFSVWGVALALLWARRSSWWAAVASGLLLGVAVLFRYTEALLLLPGLVAAVLQLSWRRGRSWGQLAAHGGAWAAVVGLMVAHNLAAFGSPTGYDPTNESTGFAREYFVDNWATMVRALDSAGLFLLVPLALAGLVLLIGWRLRVAAVLWAWVLPSVLLYTAYYWAPDPEGLGYARFFVTILPGLAAAAAGLAAWLLAAGPQLARPSLVYAAAALIVALSVGVNLRGVIPQWQMDQARRLALLDSGRRVLDTAPPGSVILSRESRLLHHLQFVGDYQLIEAGLFEPHAIQRMKDVDPDEPQGLQPQRALVLYDKLKDLDRTALRKEYLGLVDAALADGRRVFLVASPRPGRKDDALGLGPYNPGVEYDVKIATSWGMLVAPEGAEVRGVPTPPGFRRAPRFGAGLQRLRIDPQAFRGSLIEFSRKPTPEAPATANATASVR